MFKKVMVAIIGMVVVACGFTEIAHAQVADKAPEANKVKDQYIVIMKDGVTATAAQSATSKVNGKIKHKYRKAVNGYTANMTAEAARELAKDPSVKLVEQDAVVSVAATQQAPAAWGLDRIDQRKLPLDKSYSYDTTGSKVTAYVLDTGIRTSHTEFNGRAINGYDFVSNDAVAEDCNGHGTHVAGTLGGNTYGVAKNVNLVGVRVLGCDGTGYYSQIIAGVDWVTANAKAPAVANISLSGGVSQAFNLAVQNSIAAGVTYVVAAGNNSDDACQLSPASVPNAITVGNTTDTDAKYSGSSYGTCLDIFAPGTGILSAHHSSDTATTRMTGTSMASPHVAGAAAMLLETNSTLKPQQVRDALVNNATTGVLTDIGTGSPNKLLYFGTAAQPKPEPVTCGPYSNGTNYNIPDLGQTVSTIKVNNCNRKASATAKVTVDVKHSYRGDLAIVLVAPDGTEYRLKSSSLFDGAQNLSATYTVNLSAKNANGDWKLRVADAQKYDTGYLDAWTFTP